MDKIAAINSIRREIGENYDIKIIESSMDYAFRFTNRDTEKFIELKYSREIFDHSQDYCIKGLIFSVKAILAAKNC